MAEPLQPPVAALLTELVEKLGLLRREMQQKGDAEKYEARFNRVDQKITALADHLAAVDPAAARALLTAWAQPARSLAFRNAEHRKKPS